MVHHFLVKVNFYLVFFSIRALPSEVTWKPFYSAHATINIFACRLGITDISDNVK